MMDEVGCFITYMKKNAPEYHIKTHVPKMRPKVTLLFSTVFILLYECANALTFKEEPHVDKEMDP